MNQVPFDQIRITHSGGPTALIEIGQLRLLADPTFDPAGSHYATGPVKLIKQTDKAERNGSLFLQSDGMRRWLPWGMRML